MWRFFNSHNEGRDHRNPAHHSFRGRALALVRRHHFEMTAASHRLADALAASPHAVYMRRDRAFEPAVVSGIQDAPVFTVSGSLPRALRRASGPVMTTRSHRARLFDAALDPVDRALLRRTGAIAIVPLSIERDLEAFLLVGGPLAAFDPDCLARALAPASACLRIARNGAPWPGSEHPLPLVAATAASAFPRQ